jgi:lycopene cyclase domain-containing protein
MLDKANYILLMNINNFEYFITLAVCTLVPMLLLVFHPNLHLRQNLKSLFLAIFITCIPFWFWDISAVILNHWSFNPKYITGLYIYNLPIEEVLFFVLIPFSCMAIWAEIRAFTTWKNFFDLLLLRK